MVLTLLPLVSLDLKKSLPPTTSAKNLPLLTALRKKETLNHLMAKTSVKSPCFRLNLRGTTWGKNSSPRSKGKKAMYFN